MGLAPAAAERFVVKTIYATYLRDFTGIGGRSLKTRTKGLNDFASWFQSCGGRLHKFRNGIVPREEKDTGSLKSDEFFKSKQMTDVLVTDGILSKTRKLEPR